MSDDNYFEYTPEDLVDRGEWARANPPVSKKETRKMMRKRGADRDRRRDEVFIQNVEKIMGESLLDYQKAFLIEAARAHAQGRPMNIHIRQGRKL